PTLDARLGLPVPCLDHGFVRAIDYFGDDAAIVQAARVSYGKGTRKVSEDRQLIRYLMRHRHTTPFEMCEIKFHVKLPIFVARQWIRHRTANVNEISGRYSVFTDEYYTPATENLARQSSDNKQGRGAVLEGDEALEVQSQLSRHAADSYALYQSLLSGPDLARELARMTLPVSYYTEWYWKIDLHNLLHFLALRLDPHAQYEIRVYAEAMASLVRDWVPVAWEAFEDYRLGSFNLSRQMVAAVRRMVAGEAVERESTGLSKREWEELRAMLGPA
ncbi:MAG: FAD-dependent thymidylate synthase, partial [Deltaproteobacteria bacterium]|nr:FAD-dependent thymidylate synthase [Deltaproteobacteria bacterium]